MKDSDIIIVGGGIIGCSIAYHLSKAGLRPTVVDQGAIGGNASAVAPGMLAPFSHTDGPGPFLDLCLASLRRYSPLAQELREETGIDIELVHSGLIRVPLSEEERQSLQKELSWQREQGLDVRWLDGQEARELEPALSPAIESVIYSTGEHHVRSPKVVQALASAASRRGATFLPGTPVLGLRRQGQRVTGVRVAGKEMGADEVVIAAGSWSGFFGEGLDLPLPVYPIRGQMVALQTISSPIQRPIVAKGGYLVPKVDGTILAGTTVEQAGFDVRVTAGGIGGILSIAARLVPAIATATVVATAAGLRPRSGDGLPFLGRVPGIEGLTLATGHFRDGILLAPITGHLIAQLLVEGRTEIALEPFSPARFALARHPSP